MTQRALRFNAGKPQLRFSLTFPEALNGIARVSTYGSHKYDLYNYMKGSPISESLDCAMRHILKWFNGEDRDADPSCPDCIKRDNEDPNHLCKVHSGCNHLDHAVWNISRACDDAHRHPEHDDRPHQVLRLAQLKEIARQMDEKNVPKDGRVAVGVAVSPCVSCRHCYVDPSADPCGDCFDRPWPEDFSVAKPPRWEPRL